MESVPNPETLKWYGDLARDGGPFLIVFVVIAVTVVFGGILLYRLAVKPTMKSLETVSDNAKAAAEAGKDAAADARVTADAHRKNLELVAQMADTNKLMFEKFLERLAEGASR